jgi:flagellar motor switch protein FliM
MDILSQDDIDALLNAIREGKVDLEKDSDQEIVAKLQEEKGNDSGQDKG